MLNTLYNLFSKFTDLSPVYSGSLCLLERQAVGGCSACHDACPHDAIRLSTRAEVLPDACTGCGLCVQACPTGALAYPQTDVLAVLNNQPHGQVNGGEGETYAPARLACSKAGLDWPTTPCLGRITVSEVLASGAWLQNLALAHGDCNACSLGGPSVPRSLQYLLNDAEDYKRSVNLCAPRPTMVSAAPGQEAAPRPDLPPGPSGSLDRREAVRAFADSAKRGAVRAIPEQLSRLVEEPREERAEEWRWRAMVLGPRAQETLFWPSPRVNDDCIMCPVCTNVCPTSAITRAPDESGGYTLTLKPSECTGCNACVTSCPPRAMRLEPMLPAESFQKDFLLHHIEGQ